MALQLKRKENATGTKWVDFDADTKIQISGIDNPEYQIALERLQRRINRNDARFDQGEIGLVDGELSNHENHCLLLASYILRDWDGVLDESGDKLKFSKDVARQLLAVNLEFFMFVISQATTFSVDSKEELVETVGKPLPASSGKKSGKAKPKSEAESTPA